MKTTKKWYQSTTIWGIVIGALGFLLSYLGVSQPVLPENADANQIKEYVEAIKAAHGNITAILSVVLSAVGTVTAIIGRFKAEQKITI